MAGCGITQSPIFTNHSCANFDDIPCDVEGGGFATCRLPAASFIVSRLLPALEVDEQGGAPIDSWLFQLDISDT